jgi:D-xylose transport system substrate-binding protein
MGVVDSLARAGLALGAALLAGAAAAQPLVGVSWAYYQEERWKSDEAALRAELLRLGAGYVFFNDTATTEKQIADVESLVARGADVLVLVAHDADAILPAVLLAEREGIPVVAYDRLIERPGIFYLSFDNREVGRLQARALLAVRPGGRYVFIKGAPTDPNADLVHAGQLDVLRPAIEAGRIEVVGDQYVEGWLPEHAQRIMEQILTRNEGRVDAVVSSNDAMAGAVVAALAAHGVAGVPVSGQDGDLAALNRVARGLQTVSVWKDARSLGREAARVAVALARGVAPGGIDGATRFAGGPQRVEVDAILLDPVPITRENLGLVIDAGWAPRDRICRGAGAHPPPACR